MVLAVVKKTRGYFVSRNVDEWYPMSLVLQSILQLYVDTLKVLNTSCQRCLGYLYRKNLSELQFANLFVRIAVCLLLQFLKLKNILNALGHLYTFLHFILLEFQQVFGQPISFFLLSFLFLLWFPGFYYLLHAFYSLKVFLN